MENKPPLVIRVVIEVCVPAKASNHPCPPGYRGMVNVGLPKDLSKFLKSLRLFPSEACMRKTQSVVDGEGYRWQVVAENKIGRVSYVYPDHPGITAPGSRSH